MTIGLCSCTAVTILHAVCGCCGGQTLLVRNHGNNYTSLQYFGVAYLRAAPGSNGIRVSKAFLSVVRNEYFYLVQHDNR